VKQGESGPDSEFELTTRLLRSLAHRIRGDLSVITNDLVYLASCYGSEEIERPQARCESIAASLGMVNLLTSGGERERVGVDVVERVLRLSVTDTEEIVSSFSLHVERMKHAMRFMYDLLGPWEGTIRALESSRGIVTCRFRFLKRGSLTKYYSALSELAEAELGEKFVVEATLFDLILRDHDCSFCFESDGKATVCTVLIGVSEV
jgi:hypothetical protein